MVMLQAFVDDSGSEPRSPHFVLAGFASTSDNWMEFIKDWRAECALTPAIHDFKMAQARAMRGDFAGQSRPARDARVLRLAGIVRRHTLLRISATLRWDDYQEIVKPHLRGRLDSPYFLLFHRIILSVATWQRHQGMPGKTDFVFDDQSTIGIEAARWYYASLDMAPPLTRARMGSTPIFGHDSDLLPLKAADMLAWQMRRALAFEDEERPSAPLRVLMGVPSIERVMSRTDLEDFVSDMPRALKG